MKQIKFLKNITLGGRPIWYAGCSYECMGKFETESGTIYKLISEDLVPRGIDKKFEDIDYIVLEVEEPKKEIVETKAEKGKTTKKAQTSKKIKPENEI